MHASDFCILSILKINAEATRLVDVHGNIFSHSWEPTESPKEV